jgi:hypothetical protein
MMMKLSHEAFSHLRNYPYRERIPGTAAMAIVFWGLLHTGMHFTETEKIALCAFVLSGLFKIGSKPYWLFWGCAIGAIAE